MESKAWLQGSRLWSYETHLCFSMHNMSLASVSERMDLNLKFITLFTTAVPSWFCWFICNLPPVLENTALAPCFRHSCDLLVSLPSLGLWCATCVHIYISTVYVSVNLSFMIFSFCYPLPHTNLFCVAYIRCKRLYN